PSPRAQTPRGSPCLLSARCSKDAPNSPPLPACASVRREGWDYDHGYLHAHPHCHLGSGVGTLQPRSLYFLLPYKSGACAPCPESLDGRRRRNFKRGLSCTEAQVARANRKDTDRALTFRGTLA